MEGRYVFADGKPTLCINPLTWRRDERRAEASLHLGAQPPAGRLQLDLWGPDTAAGIRYTALALPRPRHTWATCDAGLLFVEEQVDEPFSEYGMFGDSYHNIDYSLFYMNIRQNARARVETLLKISSSRCSSHRTSRGGSGSR